MTQFSDDYVYFVYDIIMENDGTFRVDKYEATLTRADKKEKLKGDYYVRTSPITSEYPEDLPTYISMLKISGYLSAYEFPNYEKEQGANYLSLNPLINIKLALLSNNHKFLGKVYNDFAIINGSNVIVKYIYYVNMNTGVESVMCLGTEKHSSKKIEELKQDGFKSIVDSPLINCLNDLGNTSGISYPLNSQPSKKR